ncbi:MAG: ABC transporter ATP-binding protein [Verrucomicrobia bacterium]|nr:ABC transporter ATP-binding protein [Verrucomicrobiota bacterium]MCH8527932.1 ABC transporter ATP-binding protein [Kiritimatiellia bacterium]
MSEPLPSRKPLIEAKNLERAYASGEEVVYAIKDVTLNIYPGEYLSLMGPSGSGKSTFFNMVGALDIPTGGTISIGGRDLRKLKPPQLAYLRCVNIGYIFQNYNLIEVVSAMRNVTLPMRFRGLTEAEAQEKAAVLLEQVGLGQRMHHLPGELSGGQQQRVAIARALANDPSLLLADEPTANLDSKTGLQIVELLSQLSKDRGVTVVSATHDHNMLAVSDRVVYLRGGEVERVVNREDLDIQVGHIE